MIGFCQSSNLAIAVLFSQSQGSSHTSLISTSLKFDATTIRTFNSLASHYSAKNEGSLVGAL
jgi:hypothetical protein